MKIPTVPTLRARHLHAVSVLSMAISASAIVLAAVPAVLFDDGTSTAEPTVALIPPACASIDPVQFPCALPSMGVRW